MNIIDSIAATYEGVDTKWFTKVKRINIVIEELQEMGVDIRWCGDRNMELLIEINGSQNFYYENEIDEALRFVRSVRDNAKYNESYLNMLKMKNNSDMDKSTENLDAKMKSLKELYRHIDHNVSIKSTVKFKLCENCGKKINEVAKKCPYCNYIIVSNEISNNVKPKEKTVKFCPSCHDKYYEGNFCINCGKKLISKSEHDKIIKKQKQQQEEKVLKNQKTCPNCLKDGEYEDNFCMFCGEKLISKWDYMNIIKRW